MLLYYKYIVSGVVHLSCIIIIVKLSVLSPFQHASRIKAVCVNPVDLTIITGNIY